MKPEVKPGQEWEKADNNRQGATRIRVLEAPRANRVKVGTVTKDGRAVRHREILLSALNNAPRGYRLVKDAPATVVSTTGIPVEHEPHDVSANDPLETCCFCGTGTRFWTALRDRTPGQQVACCEACATSRRPEDVPSKTAWFLAARAARTGAAQPAPSPLARVREALEQCHAGQNGPTVAGPALAALAPLERALPGIMQALHYYRRNDRKNGGHRPLEWAECPNCRALLEGTS